MSGEEGGTWSAENQAESDIDSERVELPAGRLGHLGGHEEDTLGTREELGAERSTAVVVSNVPESTGQGQDEVENYLMN